MGPQLTASGSYFEPLNLAIREATLVAVNEANEALKQLSPNMGSYLNEVSKLATHLTFYPPPSTILTGSTGQPCRARLAARLLGQQLRAAV